MARWAPAAEEEVAGGRPDHTGERETRERERRETERDLREDSIGTVWRVGRNRGSQTMRVGCVGCLGFQGGRMGPARAWLARTLGRERAVAGRLGY
jgi:hypothetical protein